MTFSELQLSEVMLLLEVCISGRLRLPETGGRNDTFVAVSS